MRSMYARETTIDETTGFRSSFSRDNLHTRASSETCMPQKAVEAGDLSADGAKELKREHLSSGYTHGECAAPFHSNHGPGKIK